MSIAKSSQSGGYIGQRTSTRVSIKSRKSARSKKRRNGSVRSRRSRRSVRAAESPPDLLLGDKWSRRGGNSYRSQVQEQRDKEFEKVYTVRPTIID